MPAGPRRLPPGRARTRHGLSAPYSRDDPPNGSATNRRTELNALPDTDRDQLPYIEFEAREVLGAVPARVERLTHSQVTRGVWRVSAGPDATAVVKVLTAPLPGDAAAADPSGFRYWRREDLIYAAGTPAPYLAAGVRCPQLLARFERPNGDISLWLEDVGGMPARAWDLAAYGRAVRRLGRAQGTYLAGAPLPQEQWLSREFLRGYHAARRPQDDVYLASDDAWRHPAIARHFTRELREPLRRLRAEQDRLRGWVESSPQTFAHLDVWPDNLFEVADELVIIDWGFAGIGAAGEDPGNLVPDSIFDFRQPASLLPDLDRTVFAAYVAGLRDASWDGDERRIRLATTAATASKYDWIAGATLARAAAETPTQPIYGAEEVDADRLFETRAIVMRFLLGWADEARDLARKLGLE